MSPLEDRLRRDLARVAAATIVPPVPTLADESPSEAPATGPSRRHRRWPVAAAIVVGLTATGVPVAAATGALPAVREAFGWTHTPGFPIVANDGTGRLVLTTHGPGGQPMQLYTAAARDGGQCVTLLLPQEREAQRVVDSECTTPEGLSELGTLNYNSSGDADGQFSIVTAAGAARLTLSIGATTRELPVTDGLSGLWLSGADMAHPLVLTSYDASGAKLAHIPLVPLNASLARVVQKHRVDRS